jgi:hypothetical protein
LKRNRRYNKWGYAYANGFDAKCTEIDAKIKGKVLVVGVYSETREEKFVFRNRF